MIPPSIQRSHLLDTIKAIDEGSLKIPRNRESTKFDLVFNGKRYPPKFVISKAHERAVPGNSELRGFSGGREANSFLESRGFTVEPQYRHLRRSSEHLNNQEP
jgi:hypothetical protein